MEKQLDEDERFYDAVDVQEERQKKFENRVAARKKEEANEMAELKAKGLLPDTIELPDKETETSSPENQQAKGENGQGWGAWGLDKAKTAVRLAVGAAIFTAAVASNFVGTLFTESDVSPVGGMSSNINGTYSDHSR